MADDVIAAPFGCEESPQCWGCYFDCPNGQTTLEPVVVPTDDETPPKGGSGP